MIVLVFVQRRDSLAMYNNLVFRCFDECAKVSTRSEVSQSRVYLTLAAIGLLQCNRLQ